MLENLRTSTLSREGLDWFVRYADSVTRADFAAFRTYLHEDCVYQVNNLLPFYGRETTALAMEQFRGAVEGMRHEVLAALGTDTSFGVELLHHYLRKDGVPITVPAAVFIDRDPESGLLLTSRAHVDFTPVFADTLRVE
jgi:hypothetical protein